ncbi:MAG: NADH-quinone oxidoreductase subunit J, partial [Candidatus Doudnabacteria bacterium]
MILASFSNVLVWAIWVVAAFACLGSGIAVISFTNPFYASLSLIGNLASLAVMYLLLSAEFVAAAQVLVYAGAVMVMFLFVTAYLGNRADAPWAGAPSWQTLGAVAAGAALFVVGMGVGSPKPRGRLSHPAAIDSSF